MIDAGIVLVPIGVVPIAIFGVLTGAAAQPSKRRRIQAVSKRVVIWRRHAAEQRLDPSGGVETGASRVPGSECSIDVAAKHVEGRKGTGRANRCDWIAAAIHSWEIRRNVAVLDARE